jgi:hypothetical protein
VFHDLNRNGERDPDEPGLEGWIVYLDLNQNGIRDPDEPFTISRPDGAYEFTELTSGTYAVRVEPQLRWIRSLFSDKRILEDFESELMTGYTMATGVGPNTRIAERAAHSGELGLVVAGQWAYRVEASTQVAQGHKISLWAQLPGIADGGLWLGFGATPTGTLAIALAPVANQLVIQQAIGYSTQTIGTMPQTYVANTWYRLEVDWQVDGSITGRLFGSDGVTLLNTVTATTQAITAGGLAFSGTGHEKYVDDVTVSGGDPTGLAIYLLPRQSMTGRDLGYYFDPGNE